jgi:hypothetical protein
MQRKRKRSTKVQIKSLLSDSTHIAFTLYFLFEDFDLVLSPAKTAIHNGTF